MAQENEIIMLLFGACFSIVLFKNRARVMRIPEAGYLLTAYYVLFTGWAFTVCEAFFLENFLNILEHVCYAASSCIALLWCRKAFAANRRDNP